MVTEKTGTRPKELVGGELERGMKLEYLFNKLLLKRGYMEVKR